MNTPSIYNTTRPFFSAFILLFLSLFQLSYSQISPTWASSPYFYADNFVPISSSVAVSGTFPITVNLDTTFSNPATNIVLAINEIRLASGTNQASVVMSKSATTGSSFSVDVNVGQTTPTPISTTVWYMKVRYMIYNPDFESANFKTASITISSGDAQFSNASSGVGFKATLPGFGANPPNDYATAVFLTGFTANANSNSYLQLNSTTSSDAVTIFFPSTSGFLKIEFNAIQADKTGIAISQWTYVQVEELTSAYGVQTSFFNPWKSYHPTNFISGLASFTILNNGQYNFTVSGLTFSTYTDSSFNKVNAWSIWARNCTSSYQHFNKDDGFCYQACPIGTYQISLNNLLCGNCNAECATCNISNSNCLTCAANRTLVGTSCGCSPGYYLNGTGSSCVACHYSCSTCQAAGQYFDCLSCNPTKNRKNIGTVGNCTCETGFIDVGVEECQDYCGDGIVKNPVAPNCDDGNTNNYDGCSSNCQWEEYFYCLNPLYTECFYNGSNGIMTIEVTRIEKNPTANIAKFFIKLTPYVVAFKDLTISNFETNITGYQIISNAVEEDGLLSFTILYTGSFEGTYSFIGVKPSASGVLSKFLARNVTILSTASNGLYLNYYSPTDYLEASSLSQASYINGLVYMSIGLLFCYGNKKEIGLELFFTIQFIYVSFAIMPAFNPFITSLLKTKSIMGWNEVTTKTIPPYPNAPVTEHMGFSVSFSENFNIMMIFPGIAFIIYVIRRLIEYRHNNNRSKGYTTEEFNETCMGKFTKFFSFDLFVYFMLFNMQQILFSTAMQVQEITNPGDIVFIIFSLLGILISIIGLVLRPNSLAAYRKDLFHRSYGDKTFLMVLTGTLILDVLLLLGVLVTRYIFYASPAIPFIITIYTGARKPFRYIWNNIRLIVLQLCLLTSIILSIIEMETSYEVHSRFSIGYSVCIGVCFLFTLGVVFFEIGKYIWKMRDQGDEESSRYESENEEESINEKVREAGFALLTGINTSRLPTNMEMSNIQASNKHKSKIGSYRAPATGRSEIPGSARVNVRSPRTHEERGQGRNVNRDDGDEGGRQGYGENRTGRKLKDNAYQDILDESAQRYM